MSDTEKDKTHLLDELDALRKRLKGLEQRQEERKETEKSLSRSSEAFLDLFNATEEIAFLQELDGTILIANNNSATFYKVSPDNIVGSSI
jgi:PAS domain-containing protein